MSTTLLKGRYNYLYLGKFLEQVIKYNDLSQYVKPIKIPTGSTTSLQLDQERVQYLLREIHDNKDKTNMFGYLTQLSAIKGILSAMKELIDEYKKDQQHIKQILGNQYMPFSHIIRFTRNVLTHSTTTNFIVDLDNFAAQRDYLAYHNIREICFSRKADQEPNLCDEDIYIKLNFTKMLSGAPLSKYVSTHELFLLCEVCYRLCMIPIKTKENQNNETIEKKNKKKNETKQKEKTKNINKKKQNKNHEKTRKVSKTTKRKQATEITKTIKSKQTNKKPTSKISKKSKENKNLKKSSQKKRTSSPISSTKKSESGK